jgi:transposase
MPPDTPKRPRGRPTGRPTKLTDDVQEQIVRALRAGNYIETAAKFAAVDKKTLYSWLDRANRGEAKYKGFLHAVNKAQADAEVSAVAVITKAAASQWQAAAWRLERKFPERWGRREHVTVEGGVKERPLVIDLITDRAQLMPTDPDAESDDAGDT